MPHVNIDDFYVDLPFRPLVTAQVGLLKIDREVRIVLSRQDLDGKDARFHIHTSHDQKRWILHFSLHREEQAREMFAKTVAEIARGPVD